MKYEITHPTKSLKGEITLTASKSESNRVLIIQALSNIDFEIKNIAAAEDTRVLKEILEKVKSNTPPKTQTYDVGAAGTTMRFLTAYLSTQPGTHILTGTERMKNRPIKILVDALRDLGADIEYTEKEGYPPLKITGKDLENCEVEIDGSVSSQYLSALLLISPELKTGLTLKFKGEITSRPYLNMTLRMLEEFGVKSEWKGNSIVVEKQSYSPPTKNYVYEVEGDWSSASYWYAFAALAKFVDLTIKGLKQKSLQGDAVVTDIFKLLGVSTKFIEGGIQLVKSVQNEGELTYDFSDCPDLAQTIAVVVAALHIPATFTGLHTLRIKETDRTLALKTELAKLGTTVEIISDDEIKIIPEELTKAPAPIATYEDHRMAMAFAAFAMLQPIAIEHPEVVKKSYPDFWKDLKKTGFEIKEI